MSFHYRYGGSTAKRTLKCPGWRVLADTLPEQDSSKAADRGSMLHECCELLERDGITYNELLEEGVEFNGFKLTEDLLTTKVAVAMESLDDLLETYGLDEIEPEALFSVSDLIGGTIDISGESEDVVLFADYKFGEGIMIEAEDNAQLLFYGWMKISSDTIKFPLHPDKKVVCAIIQPADRREEPLDVWEVTVQDLADFGEKFKKAVAIAESSKVGENLCTGSWCKFCPAEGLGDCRAKNSEASVQMNALRSLSNVEKDSGDFELAEVGDALDLKTALAIAEKLEPWIKDVRSFACKQLELGLEPEDIGWKLVPKRAQRKWVNEKQITQYLKRKLKARNAVTEKVISPAQAEKASKKLGIILRLKDMITSKSSGTTLVPESDKREAVLSHKAIAEKLKLLHTTEELPHE